MSPTTTVVVAFTCVVLGSACSSGQSTPAGPTTTSPLVAGTWAGTASRTGVTVALRLVLTESALGRTALVNGTYTSSGAGAATGTVGGAVAGTDVSLVLTPDAPLSCAQPQVFPPGQISLLLTLSGNTLTGESVFVLCGDSVRGTAALTR